LDLRLCYNRSEDTFPLPPKIKAFYGAFGFPELPEARPYISSNFVMAIDGKASFRELKGRTSGSEVSQSSEDRWLMDFLRAHHDAQLMGVKTMREEPGNEAGGWDYGIDDEELRAYRRDVLKLGPERVIILTSCEHIDLSLRVFNSPRVEPWVLTTIDGEKKLAPRLKAAGRENAVKIVSVGRGTLVDVAAAAKMLRQEHGIRTLLCEGGPMVYGELLQRHLIDEDFRTISLQVLGRSSDANVSRPTAYGDLSFMPENAPWFRLISLHYALPYHLFLRMRYVGARRFTAGNSL
jgi:riboflavin biosynthesis pyrimidine reductase